MSLVLQHMLVWGEEGGVVTGWASLQDATAALVRVRAHFGPTPELVHIERSSAFLSQWSEDDWAHLGKNVMSHTSRH